MCTSSKYYPWKYHRPWAYKHRTSSLLPNSQNVVPILKHSSINLLSYHQHWISCMKTKGSHSSTPPSPLMHTHTHTHTQLSCALILELTCLSLFRYFVSCDFYGLWSEVTYQSKPFSSTVERCPKTRDLWLIGPWD